MVEVIRWCLELGVPVITFYAFSLDNFRRSGPEVAGLMALAEAKYGELAAVRGRALRCCAALAFAARVLSLTRGEVFD